MTSIKNFLDFARCSGKTYSIKQQALKDLESGKTVAIISAFPDIYKVIGGKRRSLNFGINPSKDHIDLFSLQQIIAMLDGSRGLDNLHTDLYWNDYVPFNKYDRVFVDPDCYEIIIFKQLKQKEEITQSLINTISSLTRELDKLHREVDIISNPYKEL